MTVRRAVVIGNGRPAQECLSILVAHPGVDIRTVVLEPGADLSQRRLSAYCKEQKLEALVNEGSINSPDAIERVTDDAPDFIFSINNFQILKPPLLSIPKIGAINFHNGPIPEYRGMNSPSWAIWNGEDSHGVSWHYMEPEVDLGDIAAEERFSLGGDETALSLTLRCIEVGVSLFESRLGQILSGERTPISARAQARYYSNSDLPSGGYLDLSWDYSKISRLLRATDFRPFPNSFTFAKLAINDQYLIINEIETKHPNTAHIPGEVVQAEGEDLTVACQDQLVRVTRVMSAAGVETSVAERIETLELRPGQQLIGGR
ncbi:MAG: methionyl-tRNA formyltransferase [Gammaproteobacteria bacterium]